MESREKTKEQLTEDLRKTREELDVQKWGLEKTLEGMKVLVKELNARIDELAKLNKFMVGRELKMIELKKEIAALKGEPRSNIEREELKKSK